MKTDGSVIIDTRIVDGGMEKGFEAIKNEMLSVGKTAEKMGDKIKSAMSGNVSAAVENAFAKVQLLEAKLASVTADFNAAVSVDDDRGAERLAARREAIYDQLEAARRRLSQTITREAEKEAAAEKRAAEKALKEKEKAYKKATKSARAFGKRLTSIMASALVFNVISKGLREITQYFGNALKSNKKFSDSWNTLKGAVLTAIQPIYEVLLPALTTAVNVAAKLARMIGNVFASLSGKSAEQIKENAEALYEQAEATEENGKAAKEAKRYLAGFDELNVVGNNTANESEASANSAKFEFQDIDINSKLSEMAELAAEAIFALGIILTLSGANIPLGLGMIVFGGMSLYESIKENWGGVEGNVLSTAEAIAIGVSAVLIAVGVIITFACAPAHLGLGIGLMVAGFSGMGYEIATNWNAIKEALQDPLTAALAVVLSTALIVVGILCCFASAWVVGIGMIVSGAVIMGMTISINWNAIKEAIQTPMGAAAMVIGGVILVVIGILACFAQAWVVGISCIVAGAAFLATTVALNWNSIKEWIQSPLGAAVMVVAGAILVVIGILCCFAQRWVVGISCIAAGAAFLVTTVVLNWDAITEAMKGPIGKMVAIVSGALLVLGVILLCCGVISPLTIGLVVAGAAGLATAIAFNWNAIVDWVKNAWNKVKEFWNQHIAQVFTGKFWTDLAKKCGNGLIAGFEGAINWIISLFETMINWIVQGLNKISFDVPNWVPGIGGKKFGFNIPEAKFKRVSIPRLAQGAVIPPNREFLAILGDQRHGTNVEAPLETIQQAVATVMGDQTAAILAGFATSVEVQREILQAVLGIQIGDDVIGSAMSRYQQKMAVVNGGLV